jgi:DNA polymerase-1
MLEGTHLLIDGKNVLYKAVFAHSKDSPVELFFKMIIKSINKSGTNNYHIFWDCPRTDTWRRKLYPEYKNHRKESDPSIGETIGLCQSIIKDISPNLGFRQYNCKGLEADDLIYSFTSIFHPSEMTILSSDSDLSQITFKCENVRQMSPGKVINGSESDDNILERPSINPILQKCLSGDKSDNIRGYEKIGPVKSAQLLESHKKLQDFISKSPFQFYFNMNLVDLSMCPYQMRARKTILDSMHKDINFNISEVRNIISKRNIYIPIHELDWSTIRENFK